MKRTVLNASEGFVLTDGEIYGTKIFLGEGRSAQEFREISLDEYEQRMKEQEEANGQDL